MPAMDQGPGWPLPLPLPARAGLPHARERRRPEVMIMADTVRAACRPVRWLTRLFISPNKLRRPSDRIEGTVVVLLSVVFLAAVAAAPWFGVRFYHSQRAGAARLRPAVAVLTQAGPGSDYFLTSGEAAARWRAPDGQRRSGLLTTMTAPGIAGAPAGARVQVWLTGSGEPQVPPSGPWEVGFVSVVIAIGAVCCGGTRGRSVQLREPSTTRRALCSCAALRMAAAM